MSPEADRVKSCLGCDTTLQWRATRCKACGKKQPAAASATPAQEPVDFARTASEREAASTVAQAPAMRELQRRNAEAGPTEDGAVGLDAPTILTMLIVGSLLGIGFGWENLYSTGYDAAAGVRVRALSQGALVTILVCASVFWIAIGWAVIRSAVLSALRAHDGGRG